MTPIVIDYEKMCEAIDKAERNWGTKHTVFFKIGYKVIFSIEGLLDFWVRKVRISVAEGEIHPGAVELMALAFKVPVSDFQKNRGGQIIEIVAEVEHDAKNHTQRR